MISTADIADRLFHTATATFTCYIANAAVIRCPIGYAEDDKFFRSNPSRRCYIRSAVFNEFDMLKDVFHFSQVPEMQVLVSKLSEGIYSCFLIYHGRKFANHPMTSDAQVSQIAMKMQAEAGRDAEAHKAFMQRLVDAQTVSTTANHKAK